MASVSAAARPAKPASGAIGTVRLRSLMPPKRHRLGTVFIGIPLLYMLLVVLPPLVFNLYASLQDWQLTEGPPDYVGLGNFLDIFSQWRWLASLGRTLAFTAVAVGIELAAGFAVALLLYQRFNTLRWLQALFLLPMMISEVAAALAWRLLLSGDGSLANWIMQALGLQPQLWLGPDWAFAAVVAVDVWQQTPFVILVLFAALQGVPVELLEAAALDGAGFLTRVRRVILPLLLPALSVVLIFRTVFALRVFTTVWILTGGGPGDKTAVLGVEIYRTAFQNFDVGVGAALSIVMLAVSILIALVSMRALRREALA